MVKAAAILRQRFPDLQFVLPVAPTLSRDFIQTFLGAGTPPVTVTEGNTGTVNAVFNVNLSVASGQVVTVNYATANDTAAAGNDYVAKSGVVTFYPGSTSQTVSITVNVLPSPSPQIRRSAAVGLSLRCLPSSSPVGPK